VLNATTLSRFIGTIYDSIAAPSVWPKALDNIVDHFESDVAWLSISNPRLQTTRMAAIAGVPDKSLLLATHVEKTRFSGSCTSWKSISQRGCKNFAL
jgi:hypothetical protein